MQKKKTDYSPGKYSKMILHIEMPLTVLFALIFLLSYLIARENDPVYANLYYPSMVVYLFYPIVITTFSILLIERLERGD